MLFGQWPRWEQWNYQSWGARTPATAEQPVAAPDETFPYISYGYYPAGS